MKRIILREAELERLLGGEEQQETPQQPSELGMEIVQNLIYALNRFYTVRGFSGGIPGTNATLWEKYNLDGLKKDLLKILHNQ